MSSRIGGARSLADATVFRTDTVAGVGVADAGPTEFLDPGRELEVRLFRAEAGGRPTVAVAWNGDTVTFGPEHTPRPDVNVEYQIHCSRDTTPSQCGETRGKGWANYLLWTWTGGFARHADGSAPYEYHIPFSAVISRPAEDAGHDHYLSAVIGSETPAGALPSGTATYRGGAAVRLFPPENGWGDDERFHSDLTLTAHFSGNTVSGVMDNWYSGDNRDDDHSGLSYTVTPAPIAGNGFTAMMEPAAGCEVCWPIESSTLAGTFYGPSAEEAGGTIRVKIGEGGDRAGHFGSGVFYSGAE